jgi:single-strand DNA-binding protein
MRDVNSLNKVLLIGRLGGKPELRYLPQNQRAIARFSVATNERIFNPTTNESRIRTEWHRIIAWGKLAEFCDPGQTGSYRRQAADPQLAGP